MTEAALPLSPAEATGGDRLHRPIRARLGVAGWALGLGAILLLR